MSGSFHVKPVNDAQFFRFHRWLLYSWPSLLKKLTLEKFYFVHTTGTFSWSIYSPFLTAQNKSYPLIARRRSIRGFSERHYIYYEGDRKFTVVKVLMVGALVLLVNVACSEGEAFVSEEGKMMGSGVFDYTAGEWIWVSATEFCMWGGGASVLKFWSRCWEGCVRNTHWSVECG